MRWKAVVKGSKPTGKTVRILSECTGQLPEKTLLAFNQEEKVVCNDLTETEAQEISDSLRKDPGVECRILPESEEEIQSPALFRVLLVNYRPGYRTRLRRRLQELTRLPQEQIILWLSRLPFALSKGIDSEAAKRIKKSITEAGGIVRIETDSLLPGKVSSRRKSNVVFRTRSVSVDTDESLSSIFSAKPAGAVDDSLIPPVCELPGKFTAGPPPLEEFENSYGNVVMHPPARFSAGLPGVSLDGGFRETPPVLPDISGKGVPGIFLFSAPGVISADDPPYVGGKSRNSSVIGPLPDIVRLFAPVSGISPNLLLPPILEIHSEESYGKDNNVSSDSYIPGAQADRVREYGKFSNSEDAVLKLFLCPPAPDDEDTVAEALRDVIGVSLRESWDLLRKPPALLETCVDHKRAIRIAHELESRGVTVSLTRGNLSAGIPPVSPGEGFQAWLSKNG